MRHVWSRIYAIGISSAVLAIGCGGSDEDVNRGSSSGADATGAGAGSSGGGTGGTGQGGAGQGGAGQGGKGGMGHGGMGQGGMGQGGMGQGGMGQGGMGQGGMGQGGMGQGGMGQGGMGQGGMGQGGMGQGGMGQGGMGQGGMGQGGMGQGGMGQGGMGQGGMGQGGMGQGGGPVNPPPPIVDLRVDVNRNGVVDLEDITEDQGEDTWDAQHGATFMANIDDDEDRCPKSGQTDSQYAACHDAADNVINGSDDLADLARIKTVPWNEAYADARGMISISVPNRVRLFRKNQNGTFTLFNPAASPLNQQDLAAGVEFAIEALDIVRNPAVWDGFVDVTLTVTGTNPMGMPMPETTDRVRMRVAPLLFRHHLHAARKVYVTKINSSSSSAFRADLNAAAQAAALPEPIYEYNGSDQWTQDFFETAYTSIPAPNGKQHVMHVNVRSANYANGTLRTAGRIVYQLRGKDVAAVVQYDPQHPDGMNTLNSFGNLETVPPYSHAGETYALGRVLRGRTPSFYPDTSFDLMVSAQAAQPIIYVNTEWLQVGHVDETMTFIKTNSPRGWAMGVNDPALARKILQKAQYAGYGHVHMFVGKYWGSNQSAEVSIDDVLADPDVMNDSAQAAIEVAGQIEVLKNETGITDAEMFAIPFLHQPTGWGSVAYQPGTVNGIYLSDTHFAAPKPWGPNISGQDVFEAQLVEAFAPYGINVHFIENWNLYHRLSGEVHCGTNTTRVVPDADRWWESMP